MIVNKPGKRFSESVAQLQNLRPNSFIFPIPKRDEMGSGTFFAGRGKRDPLAEEENSIAEEDDEEEGSIHQQMYKRSEDEDAVASFFAGRGKKDGLEHLTDASFFAGRGKRLPDGSDHLMTDASFFAGRGKKADLEEEQPDLASFFAGRGKRGEISEDLAFFAGRGKREAKGGDAQAGGAANNEEKAIFWAVRG